MSLFENYYNNAVVELQNGELTKEEISIVLNVSERLLLLMEGLINVKIKEMNLVDLDAMRRGKIAVATAKILLKSLNYGVEQATKNLELNKKEAD